MGPSASGRDVWRDERGNEVIAPAALPGLTTVFKGHGCVLEIEPGARIGSLRVEFFGSNARCRIGAAGPRGSFSAVVRLGEGCEVQVGPRVTTTSKVFLAASEGARLVLGEDCMLATDVQLRTDDAHAIYDVHTGQRLNPASDIVIGEHVWLAYGVRCLGGTRIGSGSVIGMGSLVNGPVPNNCIAVGTPARVVRRDVAWERPHLSIDPPFAPDPLARPAYWQATRD